MDDMEKAFVEGLRKAASDRPALDPIDVDAVIAGAGRRRPPSRWLTAGVAAALVVVVGVGAWVWRANQGVPAVPADTTSVPGPATLAGTRWQVTTISGTPAVATRDGEVPFLQFDTDALASGGDPCNRMGGAYTLDGTSLRFDPWAVTEMACGEGEVVAQQGRFQQALWATTAVRRDGPGLELLDDAGTVLVRFAEVAYLPVPAASASPTDPDSPVVGPAPGTVTATPSPGPALTGGVQVRIRNDAGFDFAGVQVLFPDGTRVDYGPLAAGASSAHVDAGEPVYSYAWVKVTTAPGPPADGRVFVLQPIDYVGEQPLASGKYTLALSIEADDLELVLEQDG